MAYKLVIFDLDGTLLDTIGDLAAAVNYAMCQKGYPEHLVEEYRYFVGNGVKKLIERSLPADKRNIPEEIASALYDFMFYYQRHLSDRTVPYEGIRELLVYLADAGIRIAVASNKYHEATCSLVAKMFPGIPFSAVSGQREGFPPKPDPLIVYDIMKHLEVLREETLYVGDSGVDMQTAENAGLTSIGVTWGFRPAEELIKNQASHVVSSPDEIKKFLQ